MPAYLISSFDTITDVSVIERYRAIAAASVAAYGGRYLVTAASPVERLEGNAPKHIAILEFPTAQRLREWYDSEAYAPARAIRADAGARDLFCVDGSP